MIQVARSVVEDELGRQPYIVGIIGQADDANLRVADALPLDAVTGYGLLPNWMGDPVQNYSELIEQRVLEWTKFQRSLSVPFYPVVCAGWDATPRGHKGTCSHGEGYPYTPVVVGVTPALFGRFIDHAVEFNNAYRPRHNVIFLHAWNEWTETSVLEPSDRFSTSLLDEVKRRSCCVRPLPTVREPELGVRLPIA